MEDVAQRLKDSFSAISLMLVFVFVWFDIRYPQIIADIHKDLPDPARTRDRENHRRMLRNSLLQKCVPLLVVNGALLYLLLPLLVDVLRTSTFKLWGFDFLKTAFLVVFLFITGFFVWSAFLGYQLWSRRANCK